LAILRSLLHETRARGAAVSNIIDEVARGPRTRAVQFMFSVAGKIRDRPTGSIQIPVSFHTQFPRIHVWRQQLGSI